MLLVILLFVVALTCWNYVVNERERAAKEARALESLEAECDFYHCNYASQYDNVTISLSSDRAFEFIGNI